MVARRHDDVRLGVLLLDTPADIRYTGGGVAAAGFAQDVAYRDIRQLLMYQFYVFLVRDDPYIFRGNDICEAGVRQLYE